MSKDLQEDSNIKLQLSFKKILELIDNGNFFIESIQESAAGIQLDKLNKDDLYARNRISLNLTIELNKLPGMENTTSTVGNLVNSTFMGAGDYYNEAVNNAMQDLKDHSAIYDVLNKFIASKVNNVMDELIEKKKNDNEASNITDIKNEILKELSGSVVKEDINKYLQLLIEKNLADPNFVSKLQASVNYEQFKKSIVRDDRLEFSQCINSYLGNKIDLIVQQKRESLIEDIKKTHPEIVKSQKFNDYITSKLIEQNERIKSTLLVKINEQDEQEIVKLKAEMGEHINDDDKLNEILNNFLVEKVNQAVDLNRDNIEVKDDEVIEGDKNLTLEIKTEVNNYIGRLILDNIQNSTFKDVSTVMMVKSSLQTGGK